MKKLLLILTKNTTMKRLLLILLCLPMIGFGQTLIPDANFEQALINLGYDTGTPNGSVPTANINTVTDLDVSNQNISDLTGIEDFTALTLLDCSYNQLTSLDVSANTALTDLNCDNNQLTSLDANTLPISLEYLQCSYNQLSILDVNVNTALLYLHSSDNQLTSLDISQNINLNDLRCQENQITTLDLSNNTALTDLDCSYNQLTSLDVSNNPNLTIILCGNNQIISLDVSNNPNLWEFECYNNLLTNLDLRNGNNNWGGWFSCYGNPYLTCINVDDSVWATNNWTESNGNIDGQHYFSNNCPPPTSIVEYTYNRELLKVTDILGRETKQTNQPLFYIYNDGTVEKRIVIE